MLKSSAFPVEARQEEVVEAGTLDEVVDLRDDKVNAPGWKKLLASKL